MKKIVLSAVFLAASFTMTAQVGVGTTDPSAALDIKSTGTDGSTRALEINNASGVLVTVYDDGNTGIGTASPLEKFHVNGTSRFGTADGTIGFTTIRAGGPQNSGYIEFHSGTTTPGTPLGRSGYIGFGNSATDADTGGIKVRAENGPLSLESGTNRVGIGNADPQHPLDVAGTIKATQLTNGNANVGSGDLGLYSQTNGWLRYATTPSAAHSWYTDGDAANGFAGGTDIMFLNNNGLDLKAQIIVRNLTTYNPANNTDFMQMYNNGNGVITNSAGSLLLYTSGAFGLHNDNVRTLTVLNNGNTGIGVNDPLTKLHVNGYITVGGADATGDVMPQEGMIRYDGTNFQGYTGAGWVNLN